MNKTLTFKFLFLLSFVLMSNPLFCDDEAYFKKEVVLNSYVQNTPINVILKHLKDLKCSEELSFEKGNMLKHAPGRYCISSADHNFSVIRINGALVFFRNNDVCSPISNLYIYGPACKNLDTKKTYVVEVVLGPGNSYYTVTGGSPGNMYMGQKLIMSDGIFRVLDSKGKIIADNNACNDSNNNVPTDIKIQFNDVTVPAGVASYSEK